MCLTFSVKDQTTAWGWKLQADSDLDLCIAHKVKLMEDEHRQWQEIMDFESWELSYSALCHNVRLSTYVRLYALSRRWQLGYMIDCTDRRTVTSALCALSRATLEDRLYLTFARYSGGHIRREPSIKPVAPRSIVRVPLQQHPSAIISNRLLQTLQPTATAKLFGSYSASSGVRQSGE